MCFSPEQADSLVQMRFWPSEPCLTFPKINTLKYVSFLQHLFNRPFQNSPVYWGLQQRFGEDLGCLLTHSSIKMLNSRLLIWPRLNPLLWLTRQDKRGLFQQTSSPRDTPTLPWAEGWRGEDLDGCRMWPMCLGLMEQLIRCCCPPPKYTHSLGLNQKKVKK